MDVEVQEKGRITLPKKIRKELGLKEKDTRVIEVRGHEVVLRPKLFLSVADVKSILKTKVHLKEIEEAGWRQ